jgi:single-strand DNA-binding protein
MNNITIAGQLGKDAEVKFLSNGDPVASFSVADSQGKDKPTIWWNCSLFGKRAESLSQYLTKGQAVTVIGQVTEREWTDKDGQKRKSMDIRVGDVALQGGKRDESAAPRPAAQAPRKPQSGGAPNLGDMDDDIPFAPVPRKALHSI